MNSEEIRSTLRSVVYNSAPYGRAGADQRAALGILLMRLGAQLALEADPQCAARLHATLKEVEGERTG